METYELLRRDRPIVEIFERIHETLEHAEKTPKDLSDTLQDHARARAHRAGPQHEVKSRSNLDGRRCGSRTC